MLLSKFNSIILIAGFMAIWFLFQEAVVLVFFCGISYCDEDLLEVRLIKLHSLRFNTSLTIHYRL